MKKEKVKPIDQTEDFDAMTPCDYLVSSEDFEWVGQDQSKMQGIVRKSVGYFQDAMKRLCKDKIALLLIVVLCTIILLSLVAPLFSGFSFDEQHIAHTNKGMFYSCSQGGIHIFGTDYLGRDMFTRIWEGSKISLLIAFLAVGVNAIIGVIYGGIAGYFGGKIDNIMMRIVEIVNGIPYLLIVILLITIMPSGIFTIVVAYSLVGWVGMARLVRGQVMQLKQQEFVISAKTMGASPYRILTKHMIPNILSIIIVNLTLAIPSAIFTEAYLSFLGLGVPVPYASLGTLANDGIANFKLFPEQLFLPAFFISLMMLSFNLLGDKLRDAFDPRLRR